MSTLRSGLDELAAQDLSALSDGRLSEGLVELQAEVETAQLEVLRRVSELDRRRSYGEEGFGSASGWLVGRCGMAWSAAKRTVGQARALADMPHTAEALTAGRLSLGQTGALIKAFHTHREPFLDAESELVAAVGALSVGQGYRLVDYWAQNLDPDQALGDANKIYGRRNLHLSPTFGGMVRVDGDLDPHGGQTVLAALNALCDHTNRHGPDGLTAPQRRADALVDICSDFLAHGDPPQTGGEKPHLTVMVDLETLLGGPGSLSEYDDGTVITPETARRLACDAGVSRVIVGPDSQPLDIGRKTRTVPAALRRAVVARDRHCQADHCDRPARWCDVHHIDHWADGGPTAAANLTLLCRTHHRMVHEGGHKAGRAPP